MIDVNPTNEKLRERACGIVARIAETDKELAKKELEENNYKIKQAILKLKYNLSYEKATEILNKNNQKLKNCFKMLEREL